MIIAQVQDPSHPRLPLRPRPRPQAPALIDRRHTFIDRAQRPRPTTHTHHQQTPKPIINDTTIDQGLVPKVNDTVVAVDTIIDHSLTAHIHTTTVVADIIDRGLAAHIHTNVVADTNTSVCNSIIVNTIIAYFDSIVPHTLAADVTIDSNIAHISVIDVCIPYSSIVAVVQDSARFFTGACRRLRDPLTRVPAANQHSDSGHIHERRQQPRNTHLQ